MGAPAGRRGCPDPRASSRRAGRPSPNTRRGGPAYPSPKRRLGPLAVDATVYPTLPRADAGPLSPEEPQGASAPALGRTLSELHREDSAPARDGPRAPARTRALGVGVERAGREGGGRSPPLGTQTPTRRRPAPTTGPSTISFSSSLDCDPSEGAPCDWGRRALCTAWDLRSHEVGAPFGRGSETGLRRGTDRRSRRWTSTSGALHSIDE